jgi:hemerythrin HHE cation binding domain-containing protein
MSRVDILTPIHKGIRSMIYKLGTELQTTDFSDDEATKAIVTRLEHNLSIATSRCILCLLHEHGGNEDDHFFPKVRAFELGMVEILIQEHREIGHKLVGLSEICAELIATKDPYQRIEIGMKLNRSANELFAYYMTHMNKEEVTILPATWQHLTDEQLLEIRAIVEAAIPPERYAEWMRWVLPSLNVNELVDMFTGLKKGAPPQVLENMILIASTAVDEERWKAVKTSLGL